MVMEQNYQKFFEKQRGCQVWGIAVITGGEIMITDS